MAQLDANQLAVLMENTWFAGLPVGLRESIVGAAQLRRLAPGQRLYLKGQAADGWYGVLQGAIKVGSTSADGRETVLTWLEPGTWFGEISLFDRLPRTHDGFAAGETLVLVVAPADFERLIDAEPALARALIQLQSRRLRLMFALLEELSTTTVEARLARQLLNLASSYGRAEAGQTVIELHLPQEDLAQLLGVSRQRINQALKAWEREGLLRQRYGRIAIVDAEGLRQAASSR
jgi:CRP/FNR family transcriptional regulator, cyclic AMP receptor protein